jgi:hypothetical protein
MGKDKKARAAARALKEVQAKAAPKLKPGSPEATLAAKKGGIAKQQKVHQNRVVRAGCRASLEDKARITDTNSKTKAGKAGGQYKHYHTEDLMAAVHARTRDYRDESMRPSYPKLEKRYCVSRSTIWDHVKLMTCDHVRMPNQGPYKFVRRKGKPWRYDDPRIYAKKSGNAAIVPPHILEIFVGVLSKADDPMILRQFTEDEASQLLMGLLDIYDVPVPQSWEIAGRPSKSWWQKFYDKPEAKHLSRGVASRLDQVRQIGQTPEAVKGWFSKVTEPLAEGDDPDAVSSMGRTRDYGFMTEEGITAYLKTQMPEFVPKLPDSEEIDEPALKQLAWEIVHDRRRQSNFDQKGHALGGKGNVVVIGTKGRKKQKRDIASGRWLTICPLLFGDGELGFCSFVVQGKFPVERSATAAAADAEAEALATGEQVDAPTGGTWGRTQVPVSVPTLRSTLGDFVTTIGSTKSGYSNHKEHLAMFKAGIAKLKAKEPWRFPFALYLDNWCVFPLCRSG